MIKSQILRFFALKNNHKENERRLEFRYVFKMIVRVDL